MFTNVCIYHLGNKYNHILKYMVNLSNTDNAILQIIIQIHSVMSLISLRELTVFCTLSILLPAGKLCKTVSFRKIFNFNV